MTNFGCAANLLQNTSPLVYPPLVEGGTLRWYEDFKFMVSGDSSQNIAIGPPMPIKSKVVYGILKWSALGATTSLQVGDQFKSDRYKLLTSTSSKSCEGNQRFDGLDVGGTFGVQPGSGAVSFGDDTFANSDLFGYSTCSQQLLINVGGTTAGVVYCGYMVYQGNP